MKKTYEFSGAWFANTDDVDRIEIGDKWLDLKKELDAGDDAHIALRYARRVRYEGDDSVFEPDLEAQRFGRLLVWIVAWNFKHPKSGEPLPVSIESLRALRGPALKVIEQAIEDHAAEVRAAVENPPIANSSENS